ncbi:GNAT family N-acetyltransferase [Tannockella kyphosi]|uniref:GNAT family N-acetyltransferase n=1 Tax=Tannockella kyphosi TaxID=2899121 RepID=UPI00201311B0|nr:GNAT family N-acetyltransferase [Tannockella kyphosi]
MEIIEGYPYVEEIKGLIQEYLIELDRDLSFQDIASEFNNLPKKYPALFVARKEDKVIGCVAYQVLSNERCEMKRLFVKKEYRNEKIGALLVETIISKAIKEGYHEMVLDTIEPLQSAIHLYHSYGFMETTGYYDNPMDDVIYMMKELT